MKDRLLFEQRKNSIRDMIYDPNYIPLKLKEMAYLMDVPHKDRGALKEVMDALVADGSVELTARGKYIKPENQNVTGVFTANARGFGFVTAEGEEEDIFIPATYVNGALHKDVVKVKVTKKTGGSRPASTSWTSAPSRPSSPPTAQSSPAVRSSATWKRTGSKSSLTKSPTRTPAPR